MRIKRRWEPSEEEKHRIRLDSQKSERETKRQLALNNIHATPKFLEICLR